MLTYERLMKAKGYYCNYCDTYHEAHEIKHRYTIETMGEWKGETPTILDHSMHCPCGSDKEIEPFDPMLWSHLRAYWEANDVPMTFLCPIFDHETNGITTGWEDVNTPDRVEKLADWYCIEVQKIEVKNNIITVTVEFC